jgi:hypothetical protein
MAALQPIRWLPLPEKEADETCIEIERFIESFCVGVKISIFFSRPFKVFAIASSQALRQQLSKTILLNSDLNVHE